MNRKSLKKSKSPRKVKKSKSPSKVKKENRSPMDGFTNEERLKLELMRNKILGSVLILVIFILLVFK